MKLPKARTEELVEQNLGQETLIYDLNTHTAFNLNETSTIIYRACHGELTFAELRHQHKFSDDFIYLALDELKTNNLLAEGGKYQSPFAGINRRDVIRQVGCASLFALPIIAGLIAPKAAQAASGVSGNNDQFTGTVGSACLRGGIQACYGEPLNMCYPTSQGDICCENANGQGTPILRGENRTTTRGPIYSSTPPMDSTADCQNTVKCCNGAASSGTCSYSLYEEEDFMQPTDGTFGYRQTCTCTCP